MIIHVNRASNLFKSFHIDVDLDRPGYKGKQKVSSSRKA